MSEPVDNHGSASDRLPKLTSPLLLGLEHYFQSRVSNDSAVRNDGLQNLEELGLTEEEAKRFMETPRSIDGRSLLTLLRDLPQVRKQKELEDEIRSLKGQLEDSHTRFSEAFSKQVDYAYLKTDVDAAYANFKNLSDELHSKRQQLTRSLYEIDEKLGLAGEQRLRFKVFGKVVLATLFAVVLAALIMWGFMASFKGVQPESSVQITYDIGSLIQAFLAGSGVLIAGLAYAIKSRRDRD